MLVQILSAVSLVESACVLVAHVYTDPKRFMLNEPRRKKTKQFRCDLTSSPLPNDVDPL
ncbi:MAG: hypothetical protein QOF89_1510 [Acidobacteriota bacterium]|nr:hypothetical protein [Acidobacteriota bacterium]